jgi:hypothetical protein
MPNMKAGFPIPIAKSISQCQKDRHIFSLPNPTNMLQGM